MNRAGRCSRRGAPRMERPGRRGECPAASQSPPGFTLTELLFSVAVIALLIGLLITGLRAASSFSRTAEQTGAVRSIQVAIESFRNDHGFIPPMVEDNDPAAPRFEAIGADRRTGPLYAAGGQPQQPVTFLSTEDRQRWAAEDRYLRGRMPNAENDRIDSDYRFSTYSFAYYLVGALGAEAGDPARLIDGVDGPGFMEVNEDGTFKRSGRRFSALLDPNKGMGGVGVHNAAEGRVVLKDRYGTPYRYYRWRRGREYTPNSGNYEVRDSFDLGVPRLLSGEDPANTDPVALRELLEKNPELKSAEYAIVGAGANRVFGDLGTEDINFLRGELGMGSGSDDKVAREGSKDNIVGVGR